MDEAEEERVSFTDADLGRFKDLIKFRPINDLKIGPSCMIVNIKNLEALFARLEAAEMLIPFVQHHCGIGENTTYCLCELPEKLDVWRKAAGK